jgi:signal transduction histidine kinase
VNLFDNAVLASDAGEVVEVIATRREGALVIEVVDHGCGMDAPTLARAFEPFFTTRSPREGRGLGLATSRAAVERLGGRLVLESEPGRGTIARILLPLVE